MKQITIFEAATGRVVSSRVVFNPADCDLQCGPGEAWVPGLIDGATHCLPGGVLTPRPAAEVEAEALAVAWQDLRRQRAAALAACDWTQAADAPVDRAAWAAYRQALRDLPGATLDPRAPPWPARPA